MNGIGSHQSSNSTKDEWLTPPDLLAKLGEFDLDPCSPIKRPWDIAKKHFTIEDDGLSVPWSGRVFCNPPYGRASEKWLDRLSEHGRGIALIFARTETKMFFKCVWDRAHALFFIKGRICFCHVDGRKTGPKANSGAPSVLVAFGQEDADFLSGVDVEGKFVRLIDR